MENAADYEQSLPKPKATASLITTDHNHLIGTPPKSTEENHQQQQISTDPSRTSTPNSSSPPAVVVAATQLNDIQNEDPKHGEEEEDIDVDGDIDNKNVVDKQQQYFKFPPGYRFCPYDEELVVHYLKKKVKGQELPYNKIRDVILYRYNPEELTEKYKVVGEKEKEWYFFTPRDRKYKNGTRPNRAAGNGYWKATGADKSVLYKGEIVGYKKALVFYQGKPPKGEKTNWIMHEYRVNEPPRQKRNAADMRLDNWVLCRMYKKVEKGGVKVQRRNQEKEEEEEEIVGHNNGALSEENSLVMTDESFSEMNVDYSFDNRDSKTNMLTPTDYYIHQSATPFYSSNGFAYEVSHYNNYMDPPLPQIANNGHHRLNETPCPAPRPISFTSNCHSSSDTILLKPKQMKEDPCFTAQQQPFRGGGAHGGFQEEFWSFPNFENYNIIPSFDFSGSFYSDYFHNLGGLSSTNAANPSMP